MLTFVVPGPLDQITGGYLFDRRVVEGARAAGRHVHVIELAGRFPDADAAARESAARSLAATPDGSVVVIDGLALPAYDRCLNAHSQRLRLVGFIHHPLSLETGLTPPEAARYAELEARLWRRMHAFICPSRSTGRALAAAGVPMSSIAVVAPGTDKPVCVPQRIAGETVRLLSVGTVCARKGYDVLIEALAPLSSCAWRLDCIGSLERSPEFVQTLREAISRHALDTRVTLHGELPPDRLGPAYVAADVFVLPSFHEGYGMAYAEALAHGLPVIATTAGAIGETVPASAALLVAPGSAEELRHALHLLLADAPLRARLAENAARAGASLPTWPQAVAHWLASLNRLTA